MSPPNTRDRSPFVREGPVPDLDLRRRLRIDNVGIVGEDFVVRRGRRVRQEVAFAHRAALIRYFRPQRGKWLLQPGDTIDDQEFGVLQTSDNKIIEHAKPRGFALATQAALAACSQTFRNPPEIGSLAYTPPVPGKAAAVPGTAVSSTAVGKAIYQPRSAVAVGAAAGTSTEFIAYAGTTRLSQ